MATLEDCEAALGRLAQRLADGDGSGGPQEFNRTLSCHVPDLEVTFSGGLRDGQIRGITTEPGPRAQIRLTASSDDLVALTDGELSFGSAWLSGRVKVEAGVRDLLKLKSML